MDALTSSHDSRLTNPPSRTSLFVDVDQSARASESRSSGLARTRVSISISVRASPDGRLTLTAIWLGAGAYVVGQDVRYGIRDMRCEMVDVDVGMACRAVAAPHDERDVDEVGSWASAISLVLS